MIAGIPKMKKLTMEPGEGVIDFANRLRRKFNSPEHQAKVKEENFIRELKYGKPKQSKPSNGNRAFKSPERPPWENKWQNE